MRYICVEDSTVISVLEYPPNVPESVAVIEITEQDYENLEKGLAYFDIQSSSIISYPQEHFNNQHIEKNNAAEREFLNSTDWMVLRHLRQKFLGLSTTLSEQQYQELEQQRHESANRIVKINNQD